MVFFFSSGNSMAYQVVMLDWDSRVFYGVVFPYDLLWDAYDNLGVACSI